MVVSGPWHEEGKKGSCNDKVGAFSAALLKTERNSIVATTDCMFHFVAP